MVTLTTAGQYVPMPPTLHVVPVSQQWCLHLLKVDINIIVDIFDLHLAHLVRRAI